MGKIDFFKIFNMTFDKGELPDEQVCSPLVDHVSPAFKALYDYQPDNKYTCPLPEPSDEEPDFDPFCKTVSCTDRLLWSNLNVSDSEEHVPTFSFEAVSDDLYLPPTNSICSVDEAFDEKWQQEDFERLLDDNRAKVKSPSELIDEIRPVMAKQELANAYHNTALLLAQKEPLISMDHQLFHRQGAAYDAIGPTELFDMLCDITDKSVHGGIKKSGRSELYSAVASIRSIQISAEDVSRNPNLIPLIDQVYDIESGRCHDPRPDEYFFSRINLTSDDVGKGDGRLLERFLDASFAGDDQAIERFLQTQGVILSPYSPKAIFHYWGPHDCGKSEAVRLDMLFLKPLQKYVHSIDDPNKLNERFALAPIQGKRLCYCPDASKIAFKEPTCALLKQLAGGRDLIGAEAKNRPHFTFVNEAKILFLSNHRLRGEFDEAFLSRLVTVPFRQTVPPEKRIPDLAEKIFRSRGYFFLVVMQSLRRLIDSNFVFQSVDCEPSYVTPETGWNGITSNDDTIHSFGKERCIMEDGAFTASQVIFDAYLSFCAEHHFDAIRDKAVFGRTFHAAFPEITSKRTSAYHGFAGIRLRDDFELPPH